MSVAGSIAIVAPRPIVDSSKSSETWWRFLASGVLLFGLIILVYWPAFSCGFIWDDDDYIVENSAIQTWDGISRIWTDPKATPQYYPLVHSTFWIEHKLWGLNPAGFHVVNVVIHAASTVTVWRILVALGVPGCCCVWRPSGSCRIGRMDY